MKGLLTLLLIMGAGGAIQAQAYVLDRIIAKVGNEYVLHSEIEERVSLWKQKQGELPEGARCTFLEEMLVTNLLVHHARIDSLEVPDEEVEKQLNRRFDNILGMMGNDIRQFEEYYGMTVSQSKEFMRADLRKQMNAEKMQNTIIEGIRVTPAEVKAYFNKIPRDSLPYFNSEVEIAEIVYKPQVSDSARAAALAKIRMIQDSIARGADFGEMARRYSDDRGSGSQNGRLGRSPRGSFVPEFEAVAYQLSKGEISDVVETEFGFHLIRLEERLGNVIDVSHILIRPAITDNDLEKAENRLMEIRALITTDSIPWLDAVRLYSDSKAQSYSNGGRVTNPNTGNTFFETSELDPDVFFATDSIDVGDVTVPLSFRTQTGDVIFKLIQLQSRTPPHRASLQQDYSKIRNAARQSKRNVAFNKWIEERITNTYILVDGTYEGCENLERWNI
ncbi:MAG: peptidylprolyl isomerase, partial [Saprospiraceae bacterium]|nr:peptidylprolyl isomerase [Saprospiraceae bacterium]